MLRKALAELGYPPRWLSEDLGEEEADDQECDSDEPESNADEQRGVEDFFAGCRRSDAEVHGEEVVDPGLK